MNNGLLRRVGRGVLYLTLALSPFLGGLPPGVQYGGDTFLNALRCLCLVAGLLALVPTPDAVEETTPRLRGAAPALMLATVGLTVVSLLVHSRFLTSPTLLFALLPGAIDWIVYGALFFAAFALAQQPRERLNVLLAVVVGATLAALYSVIEAAAATLPGQRAQGPFFSPNFAAGLFALCLPVTVAWCLRAHDARAAIGLGAASALMAGALVASGSRAGIALAVLGLLAALVLSAIGRQARRLPWARVAFVGAALLVAGFLLRGAITTRAAQGVQEQSGDFRKWTWAGTVNMAKANPLFGTGPGTYPYAYPRYAIVEKTDLAHSSYLQVASEQGLPVLLTTVATLGAVLLGTVAALWKTRRDAAHDGVTLLVCGLVGGLLAAMGRSVFDSEWSLLANGIPFWSLAGLLGGTALSLTAATVRPKDKAQPTLPRAVAGIALGLGLLATLMCLRTSQARDLMRDAARTRLEPLAPGGNFGWPPDPEMALLGGRADLAATWEPSGKRFYQLGRLQVQAATQQARSEGRQVSAEELAPPIESLRAATGADPNNLQAWNRLAETLAQAGRTDESRAAYRELVRRYEGPAGQVRAIPELTETYPAFAYYSLGQASEQDGNATAAAQQYEKAAQVIERYARTSPLYQQVELQSAANSRVDLAGRRRDLADLYGQIIEARIKREPARKAELDAARAETLSRMAQMPLPQTPGGTAYTPAP